LAETITEIKPIKKKRVHSVEFWRFVFTALVAIYHLEISLRGFTLKLMPSGTTAVEFFFILAGFTMAMSAKRRSDKLGGLPMSTREAHKLAINYVKDKLKAIYPILIIVLIVHIFFLSTGFTTFGQRIKAFLNDEWHMTFMIGTPFGYNNGGASRGGIAALTPFWFLTELLLVGYIYTFLVNKNFNLMTWASPAIALLGYIFFTLNSSSILEFYSKMGFLNAGTVHALSEMAMGISIFQLYEYLSNKKWRLPGKILLQVIELFAIVRFFMLVFFAPLGLENFKRVLYLMVIIVFSFLNKTWLSNALNNFVSKGLGKISLAMYLIHWPLAMVYVSFIGFLKTHVAGSLGSDPNAVGFWNALENACVYDYKTRGFNLTATDAVIYLLMVIGSAIIITLLIAVLKYVSKLLYGKYRAKYPAEAVE